MGYLALFLLMTADDAGDTLAKKMLPLYVKEAEAYSLTVESAPKKLFELKKEPVFEWSNPARGGGQQGVVFVWLRDGRPAALASIFSAPAAARFPGGRRVVHEFHALDPERLVVTRDAFNEWKPEAGLERTEVSGAGVPAGAAGTRLVQMRQLAKEFTGRTVDKDGKPWELRLLPAPLYRYPVAETGVVDGALFALVSDAGTDPEVLLVIEARKAGDKLRWEYACGRFSDLEIHMFRKNKEVFSSVPGETNPFTHDPKHTYRIYAEKVLTPEGKLLARIRQMPNGPVVIPVQEK
ncbi:hypothetical protein [Fimbriiglobus ruber]|uniref:Uncharacterized protein n=1 Tax=Fimbriiglobus ruber TaxID=1908690 RepID=A0A225DNQ9_9BACT|nr:hypothetical protein [Fimbriiglobus ruber]OWK43042.1 hypothetical protein FRUB_02641 [Fimbriiglobus ruber]